MNACPIAQTSHAKGQSRKAFDNNSFDLRADHAAEHTGMQNVIMSCQFVMGEIEEDTKPEDV